VDAGDESPSETLAVLENELAQYSAVFATRPKHVVFNKSDVTENRERFAEVSKTIEGASFISAVTGEGVDALFEVLWESVDRVRKEEAGIEIPVAPEVEYVYEAPYSVEHADGGFVVTGKAIDRTVMMTDFTNDDAVRHMQKTLDKMGLFKALKRLGAKEGQSIVVGGVELEYRSD
jgi:GTP-binding protein